MHKIDTVLFDLDGTLVNSNELIIKSLKETLKKYLPHKKFSRQNFIDMIGPPLKASFSVASKNPNVINEMIKFYRKVYIKLEFKYISLYPNVIKTLQVLSKNNINLGIVTTKFKESAMPSIKFYGIDKYINSYCFLDDVTEHKPHPEPIYYALNQFSNYNTVLMVGDNDSDLLAGKNAGCLTCGIEWSIKKELIKELNPDYWIKDFLELLNIINREEQNG